MAQWLMFLVANAVDKTLQPRARLHRKLVRTLNENDRLLDTLFVSTNYDILIDNALTEEWERNTDLDYGVNFGTSSVPTIGCGLAPDVALSCSSPTVR
jgi:hypothetical protein